MTTTNTDAQASYKVCKITTNVPSSLSKGFYIMPDGTLGKTKSGMLTKGVYEVIEVGGPQEFADLLTSLDHTNALTYGIPKTSKTSGTVSSRKTATSGETTRTREHFEFKEYPGVLMLDIDDHKYSFEECETALREIIDGYDEAPKVLANSASTYIYNGDEQCKGEGGKRIYIFVTDAKDIPRAGAVIGNRLKLAGIFHYDISISGSLLEKTLIDEKVFQPERLDYAGGAFCHPPLVQKRPEAVVRNNGAEPINTRSAVKSLNADEINKLKEIKSEAKVAIKGEQLKVRTEWVNSTIQNEEKKTGRLFNDAEREEMQKNLMDASEKGMLYGDFVLYPENGDPVTVGQILDDPDKWHGCKFSDPLEPDYGNDNRIAWVNLKSGGRPYIRSFAHGGKKYTLVRPSAQIQVVTGEIPRVVDDVMAVIRQDGVIFQQGRTLVRVAGSNVEPVSEVWLKNYIEQRVKFHTFKKMKNDFISVPANCPSEVPKRIMANYGAWNLKTLNSVITLPVMRTDGSIINQPGYDESTNILLVNYNSEKFPTISDNPSDQSIKDALERIFKPFRKFPFKSNIDRGVLLASILTIAVRQVLDTTPGFLFKSATFGSGKTLLALCVEAIADTSRSIMAWPDQQAEQRKSLVTVLQSAPPIIILDNLMGNWNSPDLAAMMTSPNFRDRILGRSENVDVVTRSLIIGTGNNVVPVGDLARRVLSCILDPEEERPDKRNFSFNPIDYIKEDILQYRIDLLTVLRGYFAAGMPTHGEGGMGSFDDWERIIRQAVCWVRDKKLFPVGIDDPIKSIDENFEEDPETNKLKALLLNWRDEYGSEDVTVAQLIFQSKAGENIFFKSILEEIAGDRGDNINSRVLGRWIEKNQKRVVNGLRIVKGKPRSGFNRWRIEVVEVVEVSVCNSNPEKNYDKSNISNNSKKNKPTKIHHSHQNNDNDDGLSKSQPKKIQ